MQEVQCAEVCRLPEKMHAALGVRDRAEAEQKEKAGLRANAVRPGDPGMKDHITSSNSIARKTEKVKRGKRQ